MSGCVDSTRSVGAALPVDDDTEEDREIALRLQGQESFLTSSTEEYAACFHTFINALRDRTFDKLVLSRHLTVDKVADFSPLSIFRAACKRYIHSYIYLCYTPQTGIWLGSTPEIILSGEKDEWHTVALAGTQPLQDGRLPQVWDERTGKNKIMLLLISVGSFFHWIFILRKTGHILLMPVLCHI